MALQGSVNVHRPKRAHNLKLCVCQSCMLVGILTLELDGGEWLASRCSRSNSLGGYWGSHCVEGRVSNRAVLEVTAGNLNLSSVVGHLTN
jgi:hypothetical protein